MSSKLNEKPTDISQESVMESCSIPFRLIIAEDDKEMRTMLSESLRGKGYEVIECADGWALIRHIGMLYLPEDREHIDLVISDIRMPGINGLEILTAMHAFEPLPPLVFITAFGDDETHSLADRLGAIDVFDKPFDMDDFLMRIHWILQMTRRITSVDKFNQEDDLEQEHDMLSRSMLEKLRKARNDG